MVSIAQIQRGFARFVDEQIVVAFDGWKKAFVGGSGALLAASIPNLLSTSSIFTNMGIVSGDRVDIDALYNAFVPRLGAEKIPISIPKVGVIKIGTAEIDQLMKCIKEA